MEDTARSAARTGLAASVGSGALCADGDGAINIDRAISMLAAPCPGATHQREVEEQFDLFFDVCEFTHSVCEGSAPIELLHTFNYWLQAVQETKRGCVHWDRYSEHATPTG